MKKLSESQKKKLWLAWVTGHKTITQLMRQVYGKENCSHIYSILAHGSKKHYQDSNKV